MSVRCLAAFLLIAPALGQSDPGWIQPRADARGTSSVDYATVTAEPLIRWRRELGAPVADPVSWGTTVYAAHEDGRDRVLVAVDIESGEVVASTKIGRGGRAHLAVWQGTVVVVEPDGLRTFRRDGDRLKQRKRVRGKGLGEPCLVGGTALLASEDSLLVVDVTRGRVVGEIDGPFRGRPAFLSEDGVSGRLAVQRLDARGEPELVTLDVEDLGQRKPNLGDPEPVALGDISSGGADLSAGRVAFMGTDGDEREVWYVACPGHYAKLVLIGLYGFAKDSPFTENAAIHGDGLFSVSKRGTFGGQTLDGQSSFFEGAEATDAPPADITIAGGVALLGNRAVEIAGRRILWRLDDVDPESTLVPVAAGWIVTWTKEGELCGISSAVETDADAGSGADTAAPELPPALVPDGPGVVDADGRFRPGAVENLPDGRWRITPEGGEAVELEGTAVAWVENGDESTRIGDEYPVYVAWRDALDGPFAEELVPHFEGYANIGMLRDCRRLLDEMRERGLPPARLTELGKTLVGKTQNVAANADRQRARIERGERASRDEFLAALLEASAWCEGRGMRTAASVLLAHADRAQPDLDAVGKRAASLVPEEFPWADADDAAARWLVWAEEMLPAGAHFLPPESEVWKGVEDTVWAKETVGFTTQNLVFLSKCEDPSVLGPCLRNGEGTIRVLQTLLASSAITDRSDPLQVRLHANAEEYYEEGTGGTRFTLGYYVPSEQVSRFFVPDDSTTDPLGRALHEVLSHELTHQYLAERWIGVDRTNPGAPGYWVVEGFARFIDDQIIELGRRGVRLDDPTVSSLDTMVQLAKSEEYLPFDFIDWTQRKFASLNPFELKATVRLKNTLGVVRLNEPVMFYEQGGALVFFLMHHRGAEGRKALIDYMRDYYQRRTNKEGWTALGFDSVEHLKDAFFAFLLELDD